MKFLIATNKRELLDEIKTKLAAVGFFDPDVAGVPSTAISEIGENFYDFILIDSDTFCGKNIKDIAKIAKNKNKATKVIVLITSSGELHIQSVLDLLDNHVDGFIYWPFSSSDLLKKMGLVTDGKDDSYTPDEIMNILKGQKYNNSDFIEITFKRVCIHVVLYLTELLGRSILLVDEQTKCNIKNAATTMFWGNKEQARTIRFRLSPVHNYILAFVDRIAVAVESIKVLEKEEEA